MCLKATYQKYTTALRTYSLLTGRRKKEKKKGESGASAYFKEGTSALASTAAALKVGALITAGAAATTLSAPVVAGLALVGGGLAAAGVDIGVEKVLDSLIPSSPSPATSGDPNAMLNKAKQNQSSLPPDKTVSLVINGPINAVLPEDVQDRLGQKNYSAYQSREYSCYARSRDSSTYIGE